MARVTTLFQKIGGGGVRSLGLAATEFGSVLAGLSVFGHPRTRFASLTQVDEIGGHSGLSHRS